MAALHLVAIEKVQPGMRVAQPVFDSNGNLLIQQGVALTERYITRLAWRGITSLYVYNEGISNLNLKVDDVIRVETRLRAIRTVKKLMSQVSVGECFSDQEVKEIIENIVDEILHHEDVVVNLSDIRAKQDYHFGHSVGVCVLSLLAGVILGFDRERLKRLGEAAILHDLGKVFVPSEILEKPGPLSSAEMAEVRRHTWLGFRALYQCSTLGPDPAQVALTHHERYDGKGYPLGLAGDEIPEFARIVALADVFDALVTDRVYRRHYLPYEAVEILTAETGTHYDPKIARAFLYNIAPYPVGSHVSLNTGELGVVTKVCRGWGVRPIVTVIRDAEGRPLRDPYQIDLRFAPTVFIVDLVQDQVPVRRAGAG
ncbi:MAG: HD-GYP domain-containing protein [Firmicutes bacterium]|nr:HD-GYP domain-containing protein [Bacillota bacterium]